MITKKTIYKFYDLLSTYSSLSKIDQLFQSEGVSANPSYESNLPGDRRSLADNYVSTLNLSDSKDEKKILNIIEMFILESESDEYIKEDSKWKIFIKMLSRDGFELKNGKLQSGKTNYIPVAIDEIVDQFDIHHVKKDWERALGQLNSDPEDAITATRAMIESTLKWILDELEEPYSPGENLNSLYKKASKQLNLSPDQHDEEIFKQILGSINGIIIGLGSLRNAYGDSHGKGRKYRKPSERHAKLAINLSGTMCMYLFETYLSNKK